MDELKEERRHVDMCLRSTGEVVTGWLLIGGIAGPATRTYWTRSSLGLLEEIEPIGWRIPPSPQVIADWRARCAA
jgi:hypothetical protein